MCGEFDVCGLFGVCVVCGVCVLSGFIHNMWNVDQSKIYGSIHNMWIVYNLRIDMLTNPHTVDQSIIWD